MLTTYMAAPSNKSDVPVRTAYGVDVSDTWVSVIRMQCARGAGRMERLLDVATRDPADALAPVLQRITAEVALDKALCAVALPARVCTARWLVTPFPSPSKARKVLPSLLDVQLPFPLEACAYGFPEMRTGPDRVEALAVAARREDVTAHVEACKKWRIDPHVVDHEGLALWSLRGGGDDACVVAYLGLDRTVWAVGREGRFHSMHSTRTGITGLETDPHAVREWSDRALRMLRAFNAGSGETDIRWVWTGPGAARADWVERLSNALTGVNQPLRFETAAQCGSALAAALARRALGFGDHLWNFRDGDTAHPQWARWRGAALRRVAWTGLAAALLLGAMNAGVHYAMNQRNRTLDRMLMERAQAITGLPFVPPGQETMLAERAVEEQRTQLAPFQRAFQPTRTEQVADVLRIAAQHDLLYDAMTLREDTLILQGSAGDWDHCEVLAAHLREQGWNVQLDRQEAIDVEYVRFRITAGRT